MRFLLRLPAGLLLVLPLLLELLLGLGLDLVEVLKLLLILLILLGEAVLVCLGHVLEPFEIVAVLLEDRAPLRPDLLVVHLFERGPSFVRVGRLRELLPGGHLALPLGRLRLLHGLDHQRPLLLVEVVVGRLGAPRLVRPLEARERHAPHGLGGPPLRLPVRLAHGGGVVGLWTAVEFKLSRRRDCLSVAAALAASSRLVSRQTECGCGARAWGESLGLLGSGGLPGQKGRRVCVWGGGGGKRAAVWVPLRSATATLRRRLEGVETVGVAARLSAGRLGSEGER